MKHIRLAIIFDQQLYSGGGYQQSLNAAILVNSISGKAIQTCFFTTIKSNISTLARHRIQAKLIPLSFTFKFLTFCYRFVANSVISKLLNRFNLTSPFEKFLMKRDIDIVYFLAPTNLARDLDRINFIATVWDLCHRDDPEFPEVRWNRQLESRDNLYRALLPRATAIFVESSLGRKNVVHRYGIDETRVYVIPFQASVGTRESPILDSSPPIDVHSKYKLDVPYVFYPAQFWAHKNHVYLLEGLNTLQFRHGLRIGAIFSGGDQGTLAYIRSYVSKLNLEDRVRFVGFVDNEEIPELYRQSVALVMPSYFGPTNLPPIEAFELGVPVLYSDKIGLRDQVDNAALLMDLNDPASMADCLKSLIDDPQLRMRLIEAGRHRLKHFNAIDSVSILSKVIDDFRWRRLTWE